MKRTLVMSSFHSHSSALLVLTFNMGGTMWKWMLKKAAKEAALFTAGTVVFVGGLVLYAIPFAVVMMCIGIVVVNML